MRTLNEIIVHCTATRADWWATRTTNQKVAEVRRWHIEDNKWKDIGYHYLIDRDGTVATGRPLDQAGAHTKGRNANSVGIALFGGHGSSANDPFEKNFTPEQDTALRNLISTLQAAHPSITMISGHNEYANKSCPGFSAKRWWDHKPERTNVAQSTTVQAASLQIASGLGGGLAALGALDGHAQIVALVLAGVVVLTAAWVMRERIRKWAAGVR